MGEVNRRNKGGNNSGDENEDNIWIFKRRKYLKKV